MAYEDALFQLGMDLTRSSTAQKEDLHEDAHVAHRGRKDFFIEREGVRFAGTHLLIDVFGGKRLDDLEHIERTLKRCVEVSGATLRHVHLHNTGPTGGVTGVAVLSESHISVHSWPEANYAAFDVFMSGDARPERCVEVLKDAFGASKVVVKPFKRGDTLDLQAWKAGAREPAAAKAPAAAGKPARTQRRARAA